MNWSRGSSIVLANWFWLSTVSFEHKSCSTRSNHHEAFKNGSFVKIVGSVRSTPSSFVSFTLPSSLPFPFDIEHRVLYRPTITCHVKTVINKDLNVRHHMPCSPWFQLGSWRHISEKSGRSEAPSLRPLQIPVTGLLVAKWLKMSPN